ncbi:MAG: PTS sugar transporter subunit IIB [Desulfohalobiaceae bacterium]|nr:PTS sugar transporter subunit IIB [Desulfohalobiaceae bacterium]
MDSLAIWVRIDNRLVHGQVIESWLPYCQANVLVVANDTLACDELQQEIISLAVSGNVGLVFTPVEKSLETYSSLNKASRPQDLFFLFANCPDAQRAYQSGLRFKAVNIGNLHYAPGKKQVCEHVALDQSDRECLSFFQGQGVKLDFRCVPNKQVQVNLH